VVKIINNLNICSRFNRESMADVLSGCHVSCYSFLVFCVVVLATSVLLLLFSFLCCVLFVFVLSLNSRRVL
jgi:hypothetical protein